MPSYDPITGEPTYPSNPSSGGKITGSLSGSNPQRYFDVFDGKWKNSMFCTLEGFDTLTLKNSTSSDIYIYDIDITIDDDFLPAYVSTTTVSGNTIYATKLSSGSSLTFQLIKVGNTGANSSEQTTYTVRAVLKYSNSNPYLPKSQWENYCSTKKVNVDYIYFKNPIIYEISVNGGTRSFYKNGTFNHDGATVTGNYKYYVDGSYSGSADVTNSASFSTPDLTTAGSKTVTVTCAGKSTTYSIDVIGVKTWGEPKLSSKWKIGQVDYSVSNATVTYGNNATSSEAVTITNFDPTTAGEQEVTYSYTASNTGDTHTYKSKVTVYDYTLVLDLSSSNVVRTYAYNATTINKTDIIVKKHYGNSGFADDVISNSDLWGAKFDTNNWDTGSKENNAGYIIIFEKDSDGNPTGKEVSYPVNVNGLASLTIDTTNAKLEFGETEPKVISGLKYYYSEWVDGETDDKGEWDGVTPTQEPVSIGDGLGVQTITKTITKNGKSVSANVDVTVYEHSEVKLTNAPTTKYITNGTLPILTFGDDFAVSVMKDTGVGEATEITSGFYYGFSPALNSELAEGNNEITVTSYYDSNKTYAGATKKFNINVQNDYPKEDTEITVEDNRTASSKVILKGNTVNLDGIIVKVDMMSGANGISFDDYDVQLVLHSDSSITKNKNDLTFNNGDTLGYYDLIISIEGVADTYTISNAVCFKGVTSITYNENGGYGHGYYINGTRIGLQNRVKIGDAIDLRSIKFRLNYSDNNHKDVFDTNGTWLTGVKINNVAKTNFLYADRYGIADYFILDVSTSLGGTINVSVPFVYLDSITITNTKTGYDIHDQLDLSKITITKNYVGDSGELYEYTKSEVASLDEFTLAFSNAGTGCSINDLIPESTRQSASVTLSLSKQEGDYTGTTAGTTTLTVKALRGVTLVDNDANVVSKFAYEYGQRHNLNNCFLYITFNTNQNPQTIAIADNLEYEYKNSIIATDTAISTSISYAYHNDTKTYNYDIHCHYLDDISVDFSSVSEIDLYSHFPLDLSDITATKTIASTDEEDETYPKTTDITNDISFTFNGQNIETGFTLPNAGTYNLVASYSLNGQRITKTQQLTVQAVTLQSIEIVTENTFKDLDSYVEEQNLNLSGLSVIVHYNRSESDQTFLYNSPLIGVVDEDGATFSKTKEIDLQDDGTELFIKYSEDGVDKFASIGTLDVAAKELVSIEIVTNPRKTHYAYGDTFSLDGMVVKANFNNGKSEALSVNALAAVSLVGHVFNPSDDGTTFDNKSVTLSYTHGNITETTTLVYSLDTPVLASIKHNVNDINEPVKKRFEDTEAFDSTGLIVTAVMENEYEVALTALQYSLNTTALYLDSNGKIQLHTNGADYGSKTVIISGINPYNNNETKSVTYDVEVTTSGAVVSAVMQIGEGADLYLVGEEYSAKGVSFKVTDIDGNIFNVTNFTTDIEKGTIFRSASRRTVKVTYTNGDYTKTEEYSILVSVPNKIDLVEDNTYQLAIGLDNGNLFTTLKDTDDKDIVFGKQYDDLGNLVAEYYPLFHENKISVDDNPLHTNTVGYNVYTGTNAQKDCVGYIDLGIEGVRNAHIVLFDDPVNPIDGNGNIEVTFPHYVEGYADRINQCQFGRIFHNRLFVAGNPNFRNCDWHSGDVNVGQLKENYDNVALHDLTYFSDLDYCYYGNQETAIVGYDQYRDGDLIVIKEGSRNQATIYRREYKLVEATAYDGSSVGENLLEETFPMFDVNSNGGVGGLSHRSIANFVGETLVLTKDGLKAITNKENAYGNMKFTYDVSSYINPAITKEDLANGILYAFGEKLLLKTNRGLYVGYNELRNDENEYEWYFLNNIGVDLFFIIDDELYFANDNGEVYRFPLEEFDYKDKSRTFIGVGGAALTISESNDTIVVSSDYASKVKENAPFHLITKYTVGGEDVKSLAHASLGNFVYGVYRDNMINGGGVFNQTAYNGLIDWENSRIILKPFTSDGAVDLAKLNKVKNYFYDGRKVYLDLITSPNPKVNANVTYYLKSVDTGDFGDITYELEDEYGNKADLSEITTFRLSFAVNHLSITKMTDIRDYGESGAKQFKLIGDHDHVLDLINYNNESYSYAGVITNEDNVKAYFETAPYAMGSIVSLKTIWSWTIVNDTALAGYMDVGYFASRKQGDYNIAVKSVPNSNGFDFGNYSFATVEFLNRKLPATYGRQRTVPSVAFIRYLFKNFEDSNMVLTTLNVVYTVANFLKGVK